MFPVPSELQNANSYVLDSRRAKFRFQNSLANCRKTRAEAINISQSRTVCASRISWNASQSTNRSNTLAAMINRLSRLSILSSFFGLLNDEVLSSIVYKGSVQIIRSYRLPGLCVSARVLSPQPLLGC